MLAVRSPLTQLFAFLRWARARGRLLRIRISGGSGIQDFGRTAASLMQVVLLLVPLTALVMGVLALTPDKGSAELVFAQPIARSDVYCWARCSDYSRRSSRRRRSGSAAAGLVIFARAGNEGLPGFVTVWIGSVILTAVFLALAALISAGQFGRRRVRALATALVVWFALALLVDIIVLGGASLLRSGHASRLLITSVLLNPISAVRTGALLAIEGTAAFGAASLALLRFTNGALGASIAIVSSLVLWIAVPATLAVRRLARMDIA
jgi:Cu-processing system permease protein